MLSIDQYSPRQFDKVDLTISSNKTGVFTLDLDTNMLGIASRIASEDVRMEDLLQAQYQNHSSLSLFNGMVKVNLLLFLYQINKKYVTTNLDLNIWLIPAVVDSMSDNPKLDDTYIRFLSWTTFMHCYIPHICNLSRRQMYFFPCSWIWPNIIHLRWPRLPKQSNIFIIIDSSLMPHKHSCMSRLNVVIWYSCGYAFIESV